MLNKRRSKRQRTQHDINDKFAVVFVEASEVQEVKQNNSDYGEEVDFQINILNSRHDNDIDEILDNNNNNDEDTDGVPVDINDVIVDFETADQFGVCKLLDLVREKEDGDTNMVKTVQQEIKDV